MRTPLSGPARPSAALAPLACAAFAAFVALVAFVAPAAGQGTDATTGDACSQADPCPWFVDIREDGLFADDDNSTWAFTQGDWFVLNATNLDWNDVDHTLTLEGYTVTLLVPAFESRQSAPFALDRAGTFRLTDERGMAGTLTVNPGDVNDADQGLIDDSGNPVAGTSSNGTPALGLPLVAFALLCAFGLARRSPK